MPAEPGPVAGVAGSRLPRCAPVAVPISGLSPPC